MYENGYADGEATRIGLMSGLLRISSPAKRRSKHRSGERASAAAVLRAAEAEKEKARVGAVKRAARSSSGASKPLGMTMISRFSFPERDSKFPRWIED